MTWFDFAPFFVIIGAVMFMAALWNHRSKVQAQEEAEMMSRRRVQAEFARIRRDRPHYIANLSREMMGDG